MEERGLALTSPANNSNGFRLDGKGAIVTGGASGIGRAIAHRFAMSGACVHVLDIDASESENSEQEISDAGGTARAYACDVSRQDEVEVVLQRIFEHERVHILVNNAGIAPIGQAGKHQRGGLRQGVQREREGLSTTACWPRLNT